MPDDHSAHEANAEPNAYKFTAGHYFYDRGGDGTDLNLRIKHGESTGWVGFYRDRDFGPQARIGVEHAYDPFQGVPFSVQLSGQAASRGFLGGSVTLEYGEPWFVLAGWGRTNARPYFNLNFDPNDALNAAAGWRSASGVTAYMLWVRDDRFATGQRHVHAVLRWPMADRQRITVDLLRKHADPALSAWATALTYEWRDLSLRIAYDRQQNFSDTNALRLSLAWRF